MDLSLSLFFCSHLRFPFAARHTKHKHNHKPLPWSCVDKIYDNHQSMAGPTSMLLCAALSSLASTTMSSAQTTTNRSGR